MTILAVGLRALWAARRRVLSRGVKAMKVPTVFAAPMGMEKGPQQAVCRGSLFQLYGQCLRLQSMLSPPFEKLTQLLGTIPTLSDVF